MAEFQTIEIESEGDCNAQKFFEIIRYKLHHLPSIFPEVYKGSEIIEGDGTKNGCVRVWKYVLPDSPEELLVKCKNEEIEDGKLMLALKVVDGDIRKYYKHFVLRISVTPKGKGSVAKWTIEYQKLHEGVDDPHHYLELFGKVSKKIDAHGLNE